MNYIVLYSLNIHKQTNKWINWNIRIVYIMWTESDILTTWVVFCAGLCSGARPSSLAFTDWRMAKMFLEKFCRGAMQIQIWWVCTKKYWLSHHLVNYKKWNIIVWGNKTKGFNVKRQIVQNCAELFILNNSEKMPWMLINVCFQVGYSILSIKILWVLPSTRTSEL